jgi:hypothetical protein
MTISKRTIELWVKAVKHLDANPNERMWMEIDYNRGSRGQYIEMIVVRDYPYDTQPTMRFGYFDGVDYEGCFMRDILDLLPKTEEVTEVQQ